MKGQGGGQTHVRIIIIIIQNSMSGDLTGDKSAC